MLKYWEYSLTNEKLQLNHNKRKQNTKSQIKTEIGYSHRAQVCKTEVSQALIFKTQFEEVSHIWQQWRANMTVTAKYYTKRWHSPLSGIVVGTGVGGAVDGTVGGAVDGTGPQRKLK